ncbi:hypothetical protein ACFL5V_13395 [Fibrobacterota bacterium]
MKLVYFRTIGLTAAFAILFAVGGCLEDDKRNTPSGPTPNTAATDQDYAGTWEGDLSDSEGGSGRLILSFSMTGGSLIGTWTRSEGTLAIPAPLTVSGGVLTFNVPNGDPDHPDCNEPDEWNPVATVMLDETLAVMHVAVEGTMCGSPVTAEGTLNKR